MSKPRVLLVLHEMSRTGAPLSALRLFEALRDDFDVRVVSRVGGPLLERYRGLFPVTVLHGPTPAGAALGRARMATYGGLGRRWSPDIVYVNTIAALPTFAKMSTIRRKPVPVVLHVREGPVYLHSVAESYPGLLQAVPDRYLVVADWLIRVLSEDFDIPPESIGVVRSPLGREWLRPAKAMRPLEGRITVGGSGVPSWTKGVELWLLTAAELVRRGNRNYHFKWVGVQDDLASHEMRRMVSKLGINGHVELVGHTPEPRPHWDQMDLFFMSSWEESAGLVVLEAMARGVPVVCFAGAGGPPEEVGETGVVVPEYSPSMAADEIERLAADGESRSRLGSEARRRVEEEFTTDRLSPKLAAELLRTMDAS